MKLMLGTKNEVIPIDFTTWGWGAKDIISQIYSIVFTELVNRDIFTVGDWSVRTKNMFLNNNIKKVMDLLEINLNGVQSVNNLIGCGFKTRKQIYERFKELNIELSSWNPDYYWTKSYKPQRRSNNGTYSTVFKDNKEKYG